MTPETHKKLSKAGLLSRTWTDKRNRLIRQAVAEGGTLRAVGEAAGLSHQAVKFIAHGRNR